MTKLYIIVGIMVALGVALSLFGNGGFAGSMSEKEKKKYSYTRKNFFLSVAEHKCYDALVQQ